MIRYSVLLVVSSLIGTLGHAQQMDPEETEVWKPVPEHIIPNGFVEKAPPSDAIVLFDGMNLDAWESVENAPIKWKVENGRITIEPGTGDIKTKQGFGSVQLHIEWLVPADIQGEGQDRANSGIFFQSKYELQVLDSYKNKTYANGIAGSIYKQQIPRLNAAREPGQWQSFDVIYIAPEFADDGNAASPARMTVFWNGILVHYDVALKGPTKYVGRPEYEAHAEKLPIVLQDHDSIVSFRNVWVREL